VLHILDRAYISFFFFFFCGRYSPCWTLASFTIALHWFRSYDFRLQFLKPIAFKPSSAESRHLTAGLPTRRVPSGLCRVNSLQGLCSCVLSSCPSHLNRLTLPLSLHLVHHIICIVHGCTLLLIFFSLTLQPSWALAAIQSPDLFTIGRTPWTCDQPVARPLPKHRTAQTQNKHIYYILNIHAQGGIGTRNHGLRAIETVHASDRSPTATGCSVPFSLISPYTRILLNILLSKIRSTLIFPF
jgi:hypothetical protein